MTSELHSTRNPDGVVTLWLASPHRSVVVLDKWLIEQLHRFFDDLEEQDPPSGFVLMSDNDRVFVAGADLGEIDQLDDKALHAYLEDAAAAFARITALHCPSVAAIHGATLGGGLEIAMHCDALIACLPPQDQKPYRVGLPEAGLGLCPGWGGTQMLPARVESARVIEWIATGFTPKVSEFGELFAECVRDPAKLQTAAIDWIGKHDPAESQRDKPVCIDSSNAERVQAALDEARPNLPDTPAAGAVVEAIETGLAEGWKAATARERELLVQLRHSDIAREKLEAFFAGSR